MKNRSIWIGLVAVMAVVLLVYSGHFHNSFHYDDTHTIVNNAYLRDLHNIPLFFSDAHTFSCIPANQSYRPLLSTTLAIDYYLGGDLIDTFQFHLTSFVIFILLGIMMFVLFRHILESASSEPYTDFIALPAVAWFMLHPACAETVNYIIQRGDLMATFFVVFGLTLYAVSPFCRKYFLYLIPVILGNLTKPSALMFAPILFCYVILFETGSGFISFWRNGSFSKVLVASLVPSIICVGGYVFISKMQHPVVQEGIASTQMYILTQPFILLYYLSAWFAPVHLTIDTDWTAFTAASDPYAVLGYVSLIAMVVVIFITSERKSTRPIAFGLVWFLLANVPTSFIPFAEVANDHRMFFPFVGLALASVWAIHLLMIYVGSRFHIEKIVNPGVGLMIAAILVASAYGTYQRNKVWQSEETLWQDCTVKSPGNGRAMLNYGLALINRGDYTDAEPYFSRALVLMPSSPYAYMDMGITEKALHKDDEAENYLRSGVAHGSQSCPACYYYYALFLNEKGRKDEAIDLLYREYELSEANIQCSELLMDLLYTAGRYDELKKLALEMVKVAPDEKANKYLRSLAEMGTRSMVAKTAEDYLNLSGQAYRTGDYQGCIDNARKAIELKPEFAQAYNNIAAAFNKLGKYKEAKEAVTRALALDPGSRLARYNLSVAEKGLKQ